MSNNEEKQPNVIWQCIKNVFNHKPQETVRETIEDLIEEANSNGENNFSEHEQLILSNVLYLKDKKCSSAMVPRADIIAFHKDGTVRELADMMVTRGHSRIPVYGEDMDDILGIVHIIDLAKIFLTGDINTKVENIVTREVKIVSPNLQVLELLRDMQTNKVHMAMVVNEYGGVDGLVTIEDLLEEIVGDIEDEYDHDEEPSIAQKDNIIIAEAKAELEELKDATGLDLEETDDEVDENGIHSLGGYVFHLMQRVPARGEHIKNKTGIDFKVLEASSTRIKKVMITLPKK